MDEECNLDVLKENYSVIQQKYGLPSFDELNRDFQIERAEVNTDYLIREIRKFIADKFSNYLRFIETILHPMNAPMFVFSMVKSLEPEDKEKLTKVYKKIAKIELDLVDLDIDFSEDKEADFIRDSYLLWQEVKKELVEIIDKIKLNWDKKFTVNGKDKKYFG